MKILAITSSPRPNSNSTCLLKAIIGAIPAGAGHSVTWLDVSSLRINPCTACKRCFRDPDKKCVQDDDMESVNQAITSADYIFMASPIYWYYVSSQLKLLIDRSYPPPYERFRGKTLHLVTTGSAPLDSVQHEVIQKSFGAICESLGCEFRYFAAQANDRDFPVANNPAALERAAALGREI